MLMAMKVLICMMEVGSGHKMPALSVQQALADKYPAAETKVIDIAKDLGVESFDRGVKQWWLSMLRHPVLFGMLYHLTENLHWPTRQFDRVLCWRVKPKLIKFLEAEKPDLIFATHCTTSNIISRLKRKGKLRIPDAILITDAFCAHSIWTEGRSDYYIFYHEGLIPVLEGRGIRREQMILKHFPLRKSFAGKEVDREKLLEKLGLSGEKRIVTLVGGGEGLGHIDESVRAYADANLNITLVVICGRNTRLLGELTEIGRNNSSNVTIVPRGFVENMHEFLAVSDITMGKSGISFSFESLFYGKPFIITQTMANEEAVRDFVVNNRLGWYAPSTEDQTAILRRLLTNDGLLDEYAANCRKLDIKNGSTEIADFLMSIGYEETR